MKIVNAAVLGLVIFVLNGCSPQLDWRQYASVEGRYAVTFPGKPREESRTIGSDVGPLAMRMTASSAAEWRFGVVWADYPEIAAREPERLIDIQRNALLRNITGRITSEKSVSLNGRPGRLVVAEGRSGDAIISLQVRFVLDGVRLYQVAATGAKGGVEQAEVETFLDSFKLASHRAE